MPRIRLLAWLSVLLLVLPGPARPDEADRAAMALIAGQERLRLRAFGDLLTSSGLDPEGLALMRRDMISQGYYFDGGAPALVARDLWISPTLAWDGNINGGVLQDRFAMNGLIFEADPEARAQAGLVAGLATGAVTRHAWDNGRVLELEALVEIGWAPEPEIGKADALISACLQNHLSGWTFLDLCALGSRYWRELDRGSAYQASAGLSRILALPNSLHEVELRYSRASTAGPDQDRLGLSLSSIWNGAATELGLTLGEEIAGQTVLRHRIDARIQWQAGQRRWQLDGWTQAYEGGSFLGVPREDRLDSLGVSVDLRPGTALRLGYLKSRSTAGIANYDQVTMDLRFDRLGW